MRPKLYLFFFLAALAPWTLEASQTRVNGTGGLSLVLDDESVSINPFTLGNPAGLALLPPKARLDLTSQFFYETDTTDNFQRHYFGTVNDMMSNTVNYNGLLFFPTEHWGVQLDGDYLYTEGYSTAGLQANGNNRVRGLFRTGYDFGPFLLGAECVPFSTTSPVVGQPSGGGQIVSGNDELDSLSVNGGLLARFPEHPAPTQDRIELGGVYDYLVNPPKDTVSLNVIPTSAVTPSPVTATFTDSNVQTFGPEVYFEAPGSLQIAVLTRFSQFSTNFKETSPDTTLVPAPIDFKAADGSGTDIVGVFKSTSPLERGLNFKLGGLVSFASDVQDSFNPTGTTTSKFTGQALQGILGVGVESPGAFSVGLQASLEDTTGTTVDGSGNTLGNTDFLSYSLSLGGEKWMDPQWAFRLGFLLADQYNNGSSPFTTFFLPALDNGVRLVTTDITVGAGFRDGGLYSDLTLVDGIVSRFDSNAYASQWTVQWAVGMQFN